MGTVILWGCASVGGVALITCAGICLAFAISALGRRVRGLVAAVRCRRGAHDLADMPGHPERLPLDDLMVDAKYWDIVGRHLDEQARARNRRAR